MRLTGPGRSPGVKEIKTMNITDQNITEQQARKLAMFERVNAKLRARKAGLRVVEVNGALVARGKNGKFQSLLNLMGA